MTYRQFLRQYQYERVAAVPDISDRLPFRESIPPEAPRRLPVRRLTAAVAAASLVLLCVISVVISQTGGSIMPPYHPSDPAVPPVTQPSATPPTTGKPTTIFKQVKATVMMNTLMVKTGETAFSEMKMERYVGARVVYLEGHQDIPGHEDCTSVFYDTVEEQVYCIDHRIMEALKREGIPASKVGVHYYNPELQKVIFTRQDKSRLSYSYDMRAETVKQLPVSLYQCPYKINSADITDYALLHKMGGNHDDLYLINVRTDEVVNVVKDGDGNYLYNPMEDDHMTADERYVIYTHGTVNGTVSSSPARTTVVYNIATGESCHVIGEVAVEMTDQLLLKTPEGYRVYHMDTDTFTAFEEANLPAQHYVYVKQTDLYSRYSYRLELYDRRTEQAILLDEDYMVDHTFSQDRRFLYYYVRGENAIRVYDMATGKRETLPLDVELTKETETGENKQHTIWFELYLDEKQGEIVLSYRVSAHPREDPEAIRQEQENDPYHVFDDFCRSEKYTGIASLEPVLKRFPQRVVAYEGDGYLYLDCSGFESEHYGGRSIILENYRDNVLCALNYNEKRWDSRLSVSTKGALISNAQEKTREALQACGVPIQPATIDYLRYFTNGEWDKLKYQVEEASASALPQKVRGYYVRSRAYTGPCDIFSSAQDMAALWEFVEFTDTLTYRLPQGEERSRYMNRQAYCLTTISIGTTSWDFYIGKDNGKAYIMRNSCVAFITSEQYDHWLIWLSEQELKGRVE